jgi:hypothetical protein
MPSDWEYEVVFIEKLVNMATDKTAQCFLSNTALAKYADDSAIECIPNATS